MLCFNVLSDAKATKLKFGEEVVQYSTDQADGISIGFTVLIESAGDEDIYLIHRRDLVQARLATKDDWLDTEGRDTPYTHLFTNVVKGRAEIDFGDDGSSRVTVMDFKDRKSINQDAPFADEGGMTTEAQLLYSTEIDTDPNRVVLRNYNDVLIDDEYCSDAYAPFTCFKIHLPAVRGDAPEHFLFRLEAKILGNSPTFRALVSEDPRERLRGYSVYGPAWVKNYVHHVDFPAAEDYVAKGFLSEDEFSSGEIFFYERIVGESGNGELLYSHTPVIYSIFAIDIRRDDVERFDNLERPINTDEESVYDLSGFIEGDPLDIPFYPSKDEGFNYRCHWYVATSRAQDFRLQFRLRMADRCEVNQREGIEQFVFA